MKLDFSKITDKIDENFILSKISAATIFSNYFGNFELGKIYSSPFRKDRNPSTGFYISKDGTLVFNDITNGEKLNCFNFVAKLYNIKYFEALKKIAQDFGLISGWAVKYDKNKVFEVDLSIEKQTLIQFEPHAWTKPYLDYWAQYSVKEKEIRKDLIFPVKRLWLNKKEIVGKELRFARIQPNKDGEIKTKIYSPYSKTMKWITNIPLSLMFGLEELKQKSDTVIITKSFKDLQLLSTIHTDVCATQNESEASLTEENQQYLLSMYKRAIIFYDNDTPGVQACTKFNEKGFGYFNIPNEYYQMFGIKDASDFIEYYGQEELIKLLKEKNIL